MKNSYVNLHRHWGHRGGILNSKLFFLLPSSLTGIIQPPEDNIKVYAAVGSAVRLPCVFSTGLTPTNLLWERVNNISLGHLPSSFALPSSHGSTWDKSASVTEVQVEDEGWYRCSGTAQGQRLSRNMKLVTIKSEFIV